MTAKVGCRLQLTFAVFFCAMADEVPTVQEVRDAIMRDAESGVQETIVDGTTVRLADLTKRMDVIREIAEDDPSVFPSSYPWGIRRYKQIPGGTG